MNTSQVYGYLHQIFRCHNVFFDVVPCDQLVFKKNRNTYLAVNTDESGKPGIHWTAIAIQDKIYCMCSYGVPLSFYSKHFSNFFKRVGKPVVQKLVCIQNNRSDVCGHYSILYLYSIFKKINFYNNFSKSLYKNDLFVKKFIQKQKFKCVNKKEDEQSCTCKI